jgi:15-cis-phytoene synthase
MQLTNILRDIGEDAQRRRIYLPHEELARFGYSRERLQRGVVNDEFVELMKFQIARARQYYASGALGIPLLTNDGSRYCVRLMSSTYSRILDSIEENQYDVFSRRAFVSSSAKLQLAAKAFFRQFIDAPRYRAVEGKCPVVTTLPAQRGIDC